MTRARRSCSRPARRRSSSSRPASRSRTSWRQVLAVGEEKLFGPLRAAIGLDEVKVANVGAAPISARRARVLPCHRRPAGRDLGDVRDVRRRRVQPARADQDRHRRPALAGRRAQARRGRRAARALEGRDGRLPQPARAHRRGARRRRLAAHRRRRHDRRGRLRHDRRPQEGADHQRGRQEHVAGEHRGGAQGQFAADRPGVRDRRRPPLQHGAARARRRLRARLGRAPGPTTATSQARATSA